MAHSFEATNFGLSVSGSSNDCDSGMVISPLDWSDIENPDQESRVESPDLHATSKSFSSQTSSDLDAERPPLRIVSFQSDDSLSCSPRSNSLRKQSSMMSFRIKA